MIKGPDRRQSQLFCPSTFAAKRGKHRDGLMFMGCDIHTHAPAEKGSTNIILYPFVLRQCSTNWLGHGHGYEWHSSDNTSGTRCACSKSDLAELPRRACPRGRESTNVCNSYTWIAPADANDVCANVSGLVGYGMAYRISRTNLLL